MAVIPGDPGTLGGNAGNSNNPIASSAGTGLVPGTTTTWHVAVLWFLGAVAMLALASPAPDIATMIMVLLIVGTLLRNWSVYKTYLGL